MRQLPRWLGLILFWTLVATPMWATPQPLYQISDPYPGFDKSTAAVAGVVDEVAIDLDSETIDRVPESMEILLPDGRRVTAQKLRFDVEPGFLSWSGQIGDADAGLGYVHLFDHGDRVSGIVNVGAERYQIVATELGHRLVRIELQDKVCLYDALDTPSHLQEAAASWHRESVISTPSSVVPPQEASPSGATADQAPPDKALTTIDVLAIYPNAFSGSAETEVRQFIASSISIANSVFASSNVNVQYRLVASVKLADQDQPPATGLKDAIEWMTEQQVGNEDVNSLGPQEMLDLRDEYAADMVSLFVPLSYSADKACAIANLPEQNGDLRPYIPDTPSRGDFGKRAFTAHRAGCGLNDFTFAHELGHNFGMRHSTTEDTNGAVHLFANGRGHALSATPWQSIANGSLQTNVSGNFTVGYHFTPSVDGYVVGLGGLFNGQKPVRLWRDGSGSQLAFALVDGNNSWTYEELLEPVAVQAGTRYTVAVYTQTGGSIYSDVVPFPRTSGQITIHGTTAIAGNARPTNTTTDIMYGQVDIRFVPTASLAATVMGCARLDGGDGDITDEVCHRIPYFSDPNIQVGGRATGTSTRNNAAVARAQAPAYAAFQTNQAPVCQNDTFTTPSNTTLSISLGNLLNNDVDPNGDPLYLASYDTSTAQGGSNDTGHVGGFNYTPAGGFSGTDWFSYTISDRPAGHPAGQSDTCVVYIDVIGAQQVVGEVGSVSGLTHTGQVVNLSRSYTSPIVIAQTLSSFGGDTAVVRITNVQSDRFTLHVDEAPDRDGPHTGETVAFLVVEAGNWQLSNGALVRAGRLQMSATVGRSLGNTWQTVNFGGSFSSVPVLFSQVQTNNDASWVKTRHLSVGTSSAQLAMERDEANTASHGTESVGWIALEPGNGTWNGHPYVASRTPNAVRHDWYSLPFGSSVSTPRLFAALATYDGADNSALRYTSLSSTAVQIRVEEDTTLDTETTHTTESVDYLVLGGSGLLTGSPQ